MPRSKSKSLPARARSSTTPSRARHTHPFRYRTQYGVIVLCQSERHHRAVFNRLRRLGFERVKVVSV